MSDRKYRQRGYQDEPREPRREHRPAEKKEYAPRGQPPMAPKTFNMPGFREVVRCSRCGHELTVAAASSPDGTCARCGAPLHSCAQCVNFDTSAAFECQQPVPARVSPKDARNECPFYEPRVTVERETKSSQGPSTARQAFDDLFK
jgi:ribosomal protein S27E